ncbi:MAG: quinolinate synthase NadA, partial [Verrucomicrobiales bacterium]|nr:quinolinate synthase NadA [Verrucomicrobiales bacterium]
MAETAKIINPGKTVVLPDRDAGCSLEESCPADKLEQFLKDNADKNYYVITYINSSAAVKALSDVICTSGNAIRIVEAAPKDRPILFAPDQNLGEWVSRQTGREMDFWEGNCYLHVEFTRESISKIKEEYPDAAVVAHPECTKAVRLLADEICSTEKMVHFCRESESKNIIVVTEAGMLHRLRKECPDKNLIAGPTDHCACAECRFMKMNTLEKLYQCLKDLQPEVTLDEELRKRAEAPIRKMLDLSAEKPKNGNNYSWEKEFVALFNKCLSKYKSGNEDFTTYYTDGDLEFLKSIGYREREFFDFVEDHVDYGDPSIESALLIAAARRDYFLYRMNSTASGEKDITPDSLPPKKAELEGIVWLPRIIAKARGKLQGILDPDIMFGCGGDRQFLATHDISPADFLRTVWSAESSDDPDAKIAEFVKEVSTA